MINRISTSELARLENRIIMLTDKWDEAASDYRHVISQGTFFNMLNPFYHLRLFLTNNHFKSISKKLKEANEEYSLMRRKAFSRY